MGVGWGKTEEIYEENYLAPENGAGAISTNDYLMLGTQLGWPALACFVTYALLRLGVGERRLPLPPALSSPAGDGEGAASSPVICQAPLQIACRAGALTMLAAFWFDGGLFKLATAVVFWTMLELGANKKSARKRPKQTRA